MSAAGNREGDAYIDIEAGGSETWTSDTFGTAAATIMENLSAQILELARGPATTPTRQDTPIGGGNVRPPETGGGQSAAEKFVNKVAPFYPPNEQGGGSAENQPTLQPSQDPNIANNQNQGQGGQEQGGQEQGGQGLGGISGNLPYKPIISDRPNADDPAVLKAAEIGHKIGLSIRLNYLGSINEVKAPQIVKSWIADKDLTSLAGETGEAREVPTVEVAVLLTKNQLSSLSGQLKIIMEKADVALDSQSRDFFQSILSASAQIANDPQAFSLKPETRLGDLGVMGEFLEDLPYKSVIMGKTEQDWYNMSYIEQDNFIRVINSKVDLYAQYDLDVSNWAKFDQENSGDWLYRVPLNMLP
jgi:hypothetical protein